MDLKRPNKDIVLTQVTLDNLEDLIKISRLTFSDTFGDQNSKSNLEEYLRDAYSSQQLSKEINNPETEFMFAYYKTELAGYLKLNVGHAQSELKEDGGLEVERIYIKTNYITSRENLGFFFYLD